MKRLFITLVALMVMSSQAFADNGKAPAGQRDALPTISLICNDCPVPAGGKPPVVAPGQHNPVTDLLDSIVDVMKMQQKVIAGELGVRNSKALQGISSKLKEIEGKIAWLKSMPMPCMQSMPCDPAQPCPTTGQPCPPPGQPCPATGQPCPPPGQPCPATGQPCPRVLSSQGR